MTSGQKIPDKVTEETFFIQVEAGQMPVFTAGPENNQRHPGLILIHEIFGLNDHIKSVARRFAKHSLRVFAPDLFFMAEKSESYRNDLNNMRSFWASMPDTRIIDYMQAVLDHARSLLVVPEQIGTIGYCMGGAMAFMLAGSSAEIAWAIDYYGRVKYPQLSANKPRHPVDYAAGLKCPVLGIFAGNDELITPADRAVLVDAVKAAGQQIQRKVYEDAPHAFFNETREHYRPEAAADAWQTTLEFIDNRVAALNMVT